MIDPWVLGLLQYRDQQSGDEQQQQEFADDILLLADVGPESAVTPTVSCVVG